MARMRMQLLPRAEAAVRKGHPWVFAESIKSQNRDGDPGELVVVYDRRDRFMAVGLYDPESPIRLRIVHAGGPATIDRSWWLARAVEAQARRRCIFSEQTTGARCINGESEGFPGLVADRYGETLVVKLYSAVWLPMWEELEAVLREVFAPTWLVLRMSRNIVAAAKDLGLEEGFRGEDGEGTVTFLENGIRFESAVLRGQKTGFFLDQRDNRARVEGLAEGREVLNLFSFSGGFSLYAARGGAKRVVDVDISEHALASARRNFALNPPLRDVSYEGIQADVFRWIQESRMSFDLIISDPPSLAKRERDREGAVTAYRRLNGAVLERLRPGGILVAASCSAHVSVDEFFGAIRSVAGKNKKSFRELWVAGHADDHPTSFPEASYLKAICLQQES